MIEMKCSVCMEIQYNISFANFYKFYRNDRKTLQITKVKTLKVDQCQVF